jgi:hypothetical protein
VLRKRGEGKTYTLGRMVEEIHALGRHLIVVVDPLAQFWPTGVSRPDQAPVPTRAIVPGDPQQVMGSRRVAAMQQHGIELGRLWLNPSDLSPAAWCSLFEYKLAEPQGIALYRALRTLAGRPFSIGDILAALMEDDLAGERQAELAYQLALAQLTPTVAPSPTPTRPPTPAPPAEGCGPRAPTGHEMRANP